MHYKSVVSMQMLRGLAYVKDNTFYNGKKLKFQNLQKK